MGLSIVTTNQIFGHTPQHIESVSRQLQRRRPGSVLDGILTPYLDILVNLIKFNAAHLDKDILVGIVQ